MRAGYFPVRMAARVGEHTAQAVSTSVAHARNLVEKCERLDAEMSKVEALKSKGKVTRVSYTMAQPLCA